MKIKIDPDFQSVVQPLSEIEYALLEQEITTKGCLDPLKVWKGHNILLDGHHRYKICQEHGIEFKVDEIEFHDRDNAEAWIIQNQLARRNLNPFQRCEIAMKAEPFLRKEAKKQQGKRTDILLLKIKGLDTQKRLAEMAGVSKTTMHHAKYIINEFNKEKGSEWAENIRKKLVDGKWRIGTVYGMIRGSGLQWERFKKRQEIEEARKKFSKELMEKETPLWEAGKIERSVYDLRAARMNMQGVYNTRTGLSLDEFINSYRLDGERGIVYYLFPDFMRELGLLKREYQRIRKIKRFAKKVSAEDKKKWLSEEYYRKGRKSYEPYFRIKPNKSSVGYAVEQLFIESFQKKST